MKKVYKRIVTTLLALTMCIPVTTLAVYDNGPSNSEYNRSDAANYIETYVENPNPDYGDYTSSGGDCTNFVSQVLRAGGMPMTPAKENPTSNDWYYYASGCGRGRSSSGTYAYEYRKYQPDVNGVGAKKEYAFVRYTPFDFENNNTGEDIYEFLEPGDVVQYVRLSTGGKTYHSQAVYDTYYSGGKYCVKVGQHTNNEFKDLRTYASSLSKSDIIVCLIKIKAPSSRVVLNDGNIEEISTMSLDSLMTYQDTLRHSVNEDIKWAGIAKVKSMMLQQKPVSECKTEISLDVLKEIVDIRIENNNNIISAFNGANDNEGLEIIAECEQENNILYLFYDKLNSSDAHITELWSEYWELIVNEEPPNYYAYG